MGTSLLTTPDGEQPVLSVDTSITFRAQKKKRNQTRRKIETAIGVGSSKCEPKPSHAKENGPTAKRNVFRVRLYSDFGHVCMYVFRSALTFCSLIFKTLNSDWKSHKAQGTHTRNFKLQSNLCVRCCDYHTHALYKPPTSLHECPLPLHVPTGAASPGQSHSSEQ